MIKFVGGPNENPLIGFGLSFANLDRLKAGEPIKVDLEQMGLQGTVLIFAGVTEQEMARQLQDLIGDETVVNIDPRLQD